MTFQRLGDWFFYDAARVDGGLPALCEIGVFTWTCALAFLKDHPTARIGLVEPDPVNFAKLLPKQIKGATLLQAALTDHDGTIPFYRYGHEQWHSSFPRHINEGMPLVAEIAVEGYTLPSILNRCEIGTCDVLLLNCEGAEIYALQQLISDPTLRARVPQVCTSFHCDHIHVYPRATRDALVSGIKRYYYLEADMQVDPPYYLFLRKDGA